MVCSSLPVSLTTNLLASLLQLWYQKHLEVFRVSFEWWVRGLMSKNSRQSFWKVKICCCTLLHHQVYVFWIWIKKGVALAFWWRRKTLYIELWVKYCGPNPTFTSPTLCMQGLSFECLIGSEALNYCRDLIKAPLQSVAIRERERQKKKVSMKDNRERRVMERYESRTSSAYQNWR